MRYREEFFKHHPGSWWFCKRCGMILRKRDVEVDHIIPLAKGGTNDHWNLQALCRTCNRRKNDRLDWNTGRDFLIKVSGHTISQLLHEYHPTKKRGKTKKG